MVGCAQWSLWRRGLVVQRFVIARPIAHAVRRVRFQCERGMGANMEEHPNASMYRDVAARINTGDFESYSELITDDIEWWEIGAAEPIRGKENLLARMQDQMA